MEIIIIPILVLITFGLFFYEKISGLFENSNKSTSTQTNQNVYSDEQINSNKELTEHVIIRDRITGRTLVPENIQPGDKIVTYVAGVTFNNHQTLIRDLDENSEIYLIREPQNVYDPNAIRVVVRTNDEFSFEEIMKLSKDCID